MSDQGPTPLDRLGEVFISYSWDDEDHVRSVLALSNRLRSEGIDCVLDQYEASPLEGWPRWMDRKIRDAQFVLVICTRSYYRRVMGEERVGTGLGVRWEGNLIYQYIYNAGTTNAKFIPVLMRPEDQQFIPTPLQGATRYHVDTQGGYDRLYARLLNSPMAQKPELGRQRPLPAREVKTDISLYVSAPVEPPLWDQARWQATFVMVPEDGSHPPILGLAFLHEAPARRIFEQWRQRYGESDEFEELRVSIIEGDISGKMPGYSVHVGPDLENMIRRYKAAGLTINPDNSYIIGVGRIHRMNPRPGSKNLEMFKQAYQHFNCYFLVPGTCELDGSKLKPILDLGILKTSIQFRRVEDIGDNDIDSIVLESGQVKRQRSPESKSRRRRK
jgi:TIR domain